MSGSTIPQTTHPAIRRAERIAAAAEQSIARSGQRVDQTLRRLANSGVGFDRARADDSDEALSAAAERWEANVEQLEIAREVRRSAFEMEGGVLVRAARSASATG